LGLKFNIPTNDTENLNSNINTTTIMHHKRTWFFFSGLYVGIELVVLVAFLLSKSYVGYVIVGVMATFICFEIFRIYRKTQIISRGHHLTNEQKLKRDSYRNQLGGYRYYYDIWYRFADSTEQEYMAEKLHQIVKKTRY